MSDTASGLRASSTTWLERSNNGIPLWRIVGGEGSIKYFKSHKLNYNKIYDKLMAERRN